MRRTRYGGYRGRRTGRDVLKYVILGLLVLIAVLASILLLGRERPTAEEHPETEQQEQISENEQTETQPEAEPEPVPEPEPEPEPFVMRALGVDLAQVLDGSWERMMEEAGANTLILNMKPDDGTLNWDFGSSVEDSDINAKLWLMNSNAEYSVARISCFRDEALANTYEYCIHSNSGYRWKDFGGVHWVSPAHVEVQDRLIEQVVDLARLGFTESSWITAAIPRMAAAKWVGSSGVRSMIWQIWMRSSETFWPDWMRRWSKRDGALRSLFEPMLWLCPTRRQREPV